MDENSHTLLERRRRLTVINGIKSVIVAEKHRILAEDRRNRTDDLAGSVGGRARGNDSRVVECLRLRVRRSLANELRTSARGPKAIAAYTCSHMKAQCRPSCADATGVICTVLNMSFQPDELTWYVSYSKDSLVAINSHHTNISISGRARFCCRLSAAAALSSSAALQRFTYQRFEQINNNLEEIDRFYSGLIVRIAAGFQSGNASSMRRPND